MPVQSHSARSRKCFHPHGGPQWADNTQRKLTRIRPPRVQITYDVETNGAIQQKELPFVVGVFSDLAGTPKEPLPEVKKAKVHRD